MENMLSIFEGFIDPVYIVSFILLSYGFRNVVSDIAKKITGKSTRRKYGVFVIGLVLGFAFFHINKSSVSDGVTNADIVKKLIASYALGTSMYELIIKWIIGRVKKKLPVSPSK